MRISDWSSDVCSSDLNAGPWKRATIMKRGHRTGKPKGGYPRFWCRHAVTAALANPNRTVRKIWGTRDALGELDLAPGLPLVYSDVADLGRMVRSVERTIELQSLIRTSYAVSCLKKNINK